MRRFLVSFVLTLAKAASLAGEPSGASFPIPQVVSEATNTPPATTEPVGRPVGFVWIKPGTFLMGSSNTEAERGKNENPLTQVTLTRGFWMGRHEVNQAEFQLVMGGDRSQFKGETLPMESVSWFNATNYCRKLSLRERAAGHLPPGYAFRLPTEAEWEYAARAGTSTVYLWGNEVGFGLANCTGCGSNFDGDRTSPVGTFAANKFGLHDVHGNVWEWVQDCWQEGYAGAPSDGSARLTGNCSSRILRGGSWLNNPSYLRIAYRNWLSSNLRDVNTGFRVARD